MLKLLQNLPPRQHVHVRGLGGRLALLVLFSALSMAGIAIGAAWDVRSAVLKDANASAERLASVARIAGRGSAEEVRGHVEAIAAGLPTGSVFGVIDSRAVVTVAMPTSAEGWTLSEPGLKEEILSRKRGAVTLVSNDGTRRLFGFASVSGPESRGPYVYVGVPVDAAFAAVRASAFRAGVVALPLGLLVLWAALTLADLLVLRRLRKLVEAMRHVAVGDVGAVPDDVPGGMGELDELTAIFDRMHRRMIEANADTDDKVRSRTADLEYNKGMAELEQARTEALISSIGEGVVATDKEGRIIYVNQEAVRMTGWEPAELVGKHEKTMLVFRDETEAPLDVDGRPATIALATGEKAVLAALPKPHSLVRKDNTAFPVNVTVSPVKFAGEIIGAIEVIRDVTDEAEFDRRKSEFISIASHQLRSPLSATKWLSDMLRKGDAGPLQEKQQELADKLFDANERMVVLVNELLNVSRLDAGVTKAAPEPTDFAALLDEVMTAAQPLLALKNQKYVFAKQPLPKAMIDPMMIREALTNMLSNASKYSPENGAVTVTAEAKGNEIALSIKDDGIGIPKADQGQLFKKFFRAGNALKSATQGTGLGLYFVKSVIELQGGKVWFESEENKGTTFFVSLPTAPNA